MEEEYDIVIDNNLYYFKEKVNKKLAKGYSLVGGVCISHDTYTTQYFQAICKKVNK